jgi:hypothetical protein
VSARGLPARHRWRHALGTGLLVITWLIGGGSPPAMAGSPSPSDGAASPAASAVRPVPVPVLAFYYIWYTPSSWNRAKVDYPLLGRYSSDDVAVMRRQVSLAKQAGITGFLVSWKDTPALDRRLATLRQVAAAAGFKLGVVFEGRDFEHRPLAMPDVISSFQYFVAHYASDPVFNIFGKPLVMWSGTWAYSRAQLASVTKAYGSHLNLIASDKSPASYAAVADLFNGDAYYWSSVNPVSTPGYAAKLDHFSTVVHSHGGLWIAPAAPGFNAGAIGGSRNIPRREGQTLRLEMNTAIDSSPDAIGLISWNEYSENTEVEPSRANSITSLTVIADIEHASAPAVENFDSSAPNGFNAGPSQFIILGGLAFLLIGSVCVIVLRRRRRLK